MVVKITADVMKQIIMPRPDVASITTLVGFYMGTTIRIPRFFEYELAFGFHRYRLLVYKYSFVFKQHAI